MKHREYKVDNEHTSLKHIVYNINTRMHIQCE